jgi:adenine-specific DNA-methyltransferase
MPIEDILRVQPAKLNHVISFEGEPRNKLICGDNLKVIRRLLNDENFNGKVN